MNKYLVHNPSLVVCVLQVEQHVLYAMYTDQGRSIVRPTVELQAEPGGWFNIGLKCFIQVNSTQSNAV